MTSKEIEVIGNLLISYRRDLNYIKNFNAFKRREISIEEYLDKAEGSFYSFLIDFRVARNVEKEQKENLLKVVYDWVSQDNSDDVDKFALHLRNHKLTHDKTMTSLASKILFLNNPTDILPFDNLVKNTLDIKMNLYSEYRLKLPEFTKKICIFLMIQGNVIWRSFFALLKCVMASL